MNSRQLAVLGQVAKAVMQAAYFVVLARSFGADSYGDIAPVLALSVLISSLSSLGLAQVLLQEGSRDNEILGAKLSSVIVVSAGTTTIACVFCVPLFSAGSMSSEVAVASILFAEATMGRVCDAIAYVHYATDRPAAAAVQQLSLPVARLLGLVPLVLTSKLTVNSWAISYLLVSIAVVGVGLLFTSRYVGSLKFSWPTLVGDIRTGSYFTVGNMASAAGTDGDKVLLSGSVDPTTIGHYAVASRIADMSLVPFRAIIANGYAKVARAGAEGLATALRSARAQYGRRATVAVLAALGALVLASQALPLLLGTSFGGADEYLLGFGTVVVFRATQITLGDVLTCAGFQRLRAFAHISVLALVVPIALFAIQRYGAWGALISSAVLEASLCLVFSLLIVLLRRERC